MIGSPEFSRNLWLEMSRTRLLMSPLIIGLIVSLLFTLLEPDEAWDYLATGALWGFALVVGVWGARLTGGSVYEELRNGTWDWQRLSPSSPWSLALGKLFGAPVYAWYCGLILLVGIALSAAKTSGLGAALLLSVWLVACALLSHGTLLLLSLQRVGDWSGRSQKDKGFGLYILALAFLPLFVGQSSLDQAALGEGLAQFDTVVWFGLSLERDLFMLAVVVALLGWVLLGLSRSFGSVLKERKLPFAWGGFLVFLAIGVAGLIPHDPATTLTATIFSATGAVAALFLLLCLALVFIERKDRLEVLRVVELVRARKWRQLAPLLPAWTLTLAVLPPVVVASMLLYLGAGEPFALLIVSGSEVAGALREGYLWFAPSLVFLLIRDVAVIHWLHLGRYAKRADAASVIYLILIYGIVPSLAVALGGEDWGVLFWPLSETTWVSALGLGFSLLSAVGAISLVIRSVK